MPVNWERDKFARLGQPVSNESDYKINEIQSRVWDGECDSERDQSEPAEIRRTNQKRMKMIRQRRTNELEK